jgi:cystathionine beta-lyase
VNFVTSTRLFKLAESLGGIKSLISHPASMTHKSIPAEKRKISGVAESLIRLSVGLEETEDLIDDLRAALEKNITAHQASHSNEHDIISSRLFDEILVNSVHPS